MPIIEHDNTTDSLYVPTPPESSEDQPNVQTEQPEPRDVGMNWEQSIVISDCESEPDDNADLQDEQYPRKVSESLQPTLINMPDHPVTRNETPQQPQVPMHDGPVQHPTNDPNNTSATVPQTSLEQAITQYALAGPYGRGWPPSVDEMMKTEEDLELWTRARHPITGDLVFNPHGTKGNADQVPKNMHSGFMSQVPI